MDRQRDHLDKRNSGCARWLPAGLYLFLLALTVMGIAHLGTWHPLWLIVFPLVPLVLYQWRTRRNAGWHQTLL